jgi:uncharacterized protein (DUF1778 family)
MTVAQHETTINMRTTTEHKERIRHAAELRHTSLSQFILDAAINRADEVIAEQQVTVLPAAFFDEFYNSLSRPAEAIPALQAIAARPRPYQQR